MAPIVIAQQLFPDNPSPVQKSDVGPSYDLLISTRDGLPLPCLNADGKTVNVAQVAFMTTIDPNRIQHEETELQHKDRLIQFASSNLIDREFEQWPQVTQGDWSGGMLQRVYSGPNADPTRYYDGTGLPWPVNDYVPQQAFVPDAIPDQAGQSVVQGPNLGDSPMVAAGDTGAGARTLLFYQRPGNVATFCTIQNQDPPRLLFYTSPVTEGSFLRDILYVGGESFYTSQTGSAGGVVNVRSVPGGALLATIAGSNGGGKMAGGMVGNATYLAVSWTDANGAHIRLYNWLTNASSFTAFTDLNISRFPPIDMAFQGGNLIFSSFQGQDFYIISFNIAAAQFTTLAKIEGTTSCYFTAVAGGLFILAENENETIAGTETRMYLLQGSTLQDIGILQVQSQGRQVPFINSVSRPTAFTSYAIWAVTFNDPASIATQRIAVFAYDVVRGKLFKLADLGSPLVPSIVFVEGQRLGVSLPAWTKLGGTGSDPTSGTDVLFSWNVIVPFPVFQVSGSKFIAQELCINAQLSGVPGQEVSPIVPPVQNGYQFISSIIDFTSSQPKLYRQIMAKFTPLESHIGVNVTLDVWLDQDPGRLTSAPDLSATINGNDQPGATRLSLQINRIATKLVYRLTVTGGNLIVGVPTNPRLINAPKMTGGVIIQAATGWVQTLMLDLAPNLQNNSKSIADIWAEQRIDNVTAYNFLRRLWRLKGGECMATFPNGDDGDWLLQDMHFDSPKPFGSVFRADQKSGFKWIATVKIREDI